MPRVPSSLYPTPAKSPNVLLRVPPDPFGWKEGTLIASSSLFLVGGVFWVPALYVYLYRKWKRMPPHSRQRAVYGALLISLTAVVIAGPQRRPWFGKRIQFRKWAIWKVWCRFVAFEVWKDSKDSSSGAYDHLKSQAISAFVPHGIFPFAIGVGGIPDMARQAFGQFRIMVATATNLFPIVRDVISLVNAVDASRPTVNRALQQGDSIGLVPGGIPEIFEGYPKPLSHPVDEFSIVPKGFLKMALRHKLPVLPIYCFGGTKMLKRLPLPDIVERISLMLRISICLFFGRFGLPIPFRQRLFYVMGDPIQPPADKNVTNESEAVDALHQQFCEELMRLFEKHKEVYGWGHKTLHLLHR